MCFLNTNFLTASLTTSQRLLPPVCGLLNWATLSLSSPRVDRPLWLNPLTIQHTVLLSSNARLLSLHTNHERSEPISSTTQETFFTRGADNYLSGLLWRIGQLLGPFNKSTQNNTQLCVSSQNNNSD